MGSAIVGAMVFALSAPISALDDATSVRMAVGYLYEIDDPVLFHEPIVLAPEVAGDAEAIGRAVAEAVAASEQAVHLRAWSFAASVFPGPAPEASPLRLCRFGPTGDREVVLDQPLPAKGATVLVPFETDRHRLVMALRIGTLDRDRLIEIQREIHEDIRAHHDEDPDFPVLLVHRVQECRDD